MHTVSLILNRYLLARRSVSVVTLAAYTALVFGLPLPAAVRKSTEPYPCQGNLCGCLSAEQCWRSCCCTTPEQRFAWAREHGVTPPDYAERPSGGWHVTPKREKECCSYETKRSASCSVEHSNDPTQEATQSDEPESRCVHFVMGIAALKCQGLSSNWMAAGLAPTPPPWFVWRVFAAAQDWITFCPLKATARATLPLLPPPRS
jgi:hypothetical protein